MLVLNNPPAAIFSYSGVDMYRSDVSASMVSITLPFGEGLTTIARHVIRRILNPQLLSSMASYDVASNICQAMRLGSSEVRDRQMLPATSYNAF